VLSQQAKRLSWSTCLVHHFSRAGHSCVACKPIVHAVLTRACHLLHCLQGKYQHGRKNGCGVYQFTNGDVYQGQFANDRMEGRGVYAFGPEGLYEGGWKVCVAAGGPWADYE
jgi:hypothetical protein